MTRANTRPNSCGRGPSARHALWVCLLGTLAGCHVLPAPPPAATGRAGQKRGLVLAKQLVEDTATQTCARPLHTGAQVACAAAKGLRNAAVEVFCKRVYLPLCRQPGPVTPDRLCLDPVCLDAELGRQTGKRLEPAQVELLVEGEEALLRLEDLIDGAARRVDVLVYQWDSDVLGWGLAERLAARAACIGPGPGGAPAVRVLVDGGGTLIHAPPGQKTAGAVSAAVGWLARQPHVRVLRVRNGFARFDHRKLVVVDGRTAFSGGRNFTLSSFFDYHDVSYVLHGPLVADMATLYEEAWCEAGGDPAHPPRGYSADGPASPPLEGCNAWARLVVNGRLKGTFARAIYQAVDHAWHHVYLENPYFSDGMLLGKLASARKRGADVRVVFARDSQSDIVDRALRVTTNRLLKAGIRVYIYPGTTHAKAASVDGRWAYVGTGNFDNLSFRRNDEVGLAVGAGPFVEELERCLFRPDFRPEWEVTAPLPATLVDYFCELLAGLVL